MLQATLQVLTDCSFSFLHNEVALKFIDDICSCCNATFVCGYFKQEAQLCILGLDAAGKTTVLYKMKHGKRVSTIPTIGFNMTIPTIGFNVEKVEFQNLSITVFDGNFAKLSPCGAGYQRNIRYIFNGERYHDCTAISLMIYTF